MVVLSASWMAEAISIDVSRLYILRTLISEVHGRVHSWNVVVRALCRHDVVVLMIESTNVRIRHFDLEGFVIRCPYGSWRVGEAAIVPK